MLDTLYLDEKMFIPVTMINMIHSLGFKDESLNQAAKILNTNYARYQNAVDQKNDREMVLYGRKYLDSVESVNEILEGKPKQIYSNFLKILPELQKMKDEEAIDAVHYLLSGENLSTENINQFNKNTGGKTSKLTKYTLGALIASAAAAYVANSLDWSQIHNALNGAYQELYMVGGGAIATLAIILEPSGHLVENELHPYDA